MYKNQLQELAQRSCFNLPSYSCVREGPDHSPHFKAKVNFNGEIFDSPTFCSTLRQAQHTAAEVALKTLSVRGPSSALAARVLSSTTGALRHTSHSSAPYFEDETGVYKNLLQETAHRAGLKLPVYVTVRSGPGHVPLFNCTVELAGMSFIGEPAKTKRQAQKKAAMTAWFTLKKLSQSSSSTSSLSEFGGKDEQEQVTVAHYLASLQSAEMNKLIQRDQHHGRHELAPVRRDVIPYGAGRSLYPMQHQSWAYSCFSPGVALCQTRPLERVFQQQSHPLAFPSASTCIPGPQVFPFVQSIFRPDQCPYFLARDQEPVSLVPGIGPFLHLSNHSMPVPVGSNSQVTIQEIDETTQMEEQSLDKDSNYGFWKINSPSNASGLTPTEVPNHPDSLCRHSKLRIQELPHGKDEGKDGNTQNFGQLGTYRNEEFSWIPPGFTSDRDRATSTKEARCRLQNPNNSRYSWSNVRTPYPSMTSFPRLARALIPPSSAAPVTVRTASVISNDSPRPESSDPLLPAPLPTRVPVSAYLTRPWLEGIKKTGGMPYATSMAPAVQIRSVIPVCSAPTPARKMPGPSQEGIFLRGERKRTEEPEGGVSAAHSEFDELQLSAAYKFEIL